MKKKEVIKQLENEVDLDVQVDFKKIDEELGVDRARLAHWLVDAGLGSMLDSENGIKKLSSTDLSTVKQKATKIFITYDLHSEEVLVELKTDGTLFFTFGTKSVNSHKNIYKHISEALLPKK